MLSQDDLDRIELAARRHQVDVDHKDVVEMCYEIRACRARWQEMLRRERFANRALAAVISYRAACPADPDATPRFLAASIALDTVLFPPPRPE